MRHPGLLDRERTVLLLIDLQESYRRVLHGWDDVVARAATLLRGCRLLGVPVLITEQYPKGLGHTAAEVASHLPPGTEVVEKLSMSCAGSARLTDDLAATGRTQVLIAGIETHACINQTVHELLQRGYQVHVPFDAISSRFEHDYRIGWEKMIGSGAVPTTVEMVCLEWVRTAEAPEFKAIQKLIK